MVNCKNGPLYTESAIIKLLYALILYCDSVPYISCTHFEMRYNKTNGVISHYWKLFPLSCGNITLDLGQYFPNFGETISNSDLSASHYLYIILCPATG